MTSCDPAGFVPDARPHVPGLFEPLQFSTSPLYSALCPVVAGDPFLRGLALHAAPGHRPEFAFFGAVHRLLLAGADHPLANFFPSVIGSSATPPRLAGPALQSFCRLYHAELLDLITTQLVQTNHVRRSVGLRAGLALIAPYVDRPVDVVEIGASAGLLLGFAGYGYRLHGRFRDTVASYGDPDSPVQIDCDVLGRHAAPNLDALPQIRSRTGIDLRPIDTTDVQSRAWLEALVWPEDDTQRRLLHAALDYAAQHPTHLVQGDAVDALPRLAAALPQDNCRVVFHCATRIHVPVQRQERFDAAIRGFGAAGPLWEVAIEYPSVEDPRPAENRKPGLEMVITDPAGRAHPVAYVSGHLQWYEPCSSAFTRGCERV